MSPNTHNYIKIKVTFSQLNNKIFSTFTPRSFFVAENMPSYSKFLCQNNI